MVFGWGESLHFAPLTPHESLEESIIRHQRLMIAKLELRPGMTVVDVGCGIGARCVGLCIRPVSRSWVSTTAQLSLKGPGS